MVATSSAASHHHIVYIGCIQCKTIGETVEHLGQDALRVHIVQGA
jgi:hypothetical protein